MIVIDKDSRVKLYQIILGTAQGRSVFMPNPS
jgi:hypothetical protein